MFKYQIVSFGQNYIFHKKVTTVQNFNRIAYSFDKTATHHRNREELIEAERNDYTESLYVDCDCHQ